jgi:hypothetical protein
MQRGDWVDGKPAGVPKLQANAWKKQVVLAEHELPGTARHDPLPTCRTAVSTGSTTSWRRASCSRSTRPRRIWSSNTNIHPHVSTTGRSWLRS